MRRIIAFAFLALALIGGWTVKAAPAFPYVLSAQPTNTFTNLIATTLVGPFGYVDYSSGSAIMVGFTNGSHQFSGFGPYTGPGYVGWTWYGTNIGSSGTVTSFADLTTNGLMLNVGTFSGSGAGLSGTAPGLNAGSAAASDIANSLSPGISYDAFSITVEGVPGLIGDGSGLSNVTATAYSGPRSPVASGTVTLVNGTNNVLTSAAHYTNQIQLTYYATNGILANVGVTRVTNDTSFMIISSNTGDTNQVHYVIFKP